MEFTPGHLIVLAIVAGLLFFGWKQLPDMARSAGRSLRIFRTEIKGLADDDAARETKNALKSPFAADEPAPPASSSAGSWAGPQPTPGPAPTTVPSEIAAPDASGKPAG